MLTTRASNYLKTLKRRPSIPVKEVETIIRNQGFPVFDSWLDFHERYAGYEDTIGRDLAIWGLVHEDPYWLAPREADIDRELYEETWYITCADVHPSYTYRLTNTGEFLGAPAQSFDTNVERLALGWEFFQTVGGRAMTMTELRAPEFRDIFLNHIKPFLVAEASDNFIRYYMNDTYLISEIVETGDFRQGNVRSNA
ncbi:MAG: hypothetical protein FWD73_17445 [Polyangiaceae bacterium]|nr:hypothetical protein [Polyangiaceae bacterium]